MGGGGGVGGGKGVLKKNGRSVGVGWGSVDLQSTRGGVRGNLGAKIVCRTTGGGA